MAFVTIDSLDGEPVEDFANNLYRAWGIGKKGKDEGLLLLLAVKDRRSRLEIGRGLEGPITDGTSGSVLRQMAPSLRAGDYGDAMLTAAAVSGPEDRRGERRQPLGIRASSASARRSRRTGRFRYRSSFWASSSCSGCSASAAGAAGEGSAEGAASAGVDRRCSRSRLCSEADGAAAGAGPPVAVSAATIRAAADSAVLAAATRRRRRLRQLVIHGTLSLTNWWASSRKLTATVWSPWSSTARPPSAGGKDRLSDLNVLCVLKDVSPEELAQRRTGLPLVAGAGQSRAAAAERTGSAHLHRLLPDRVSRHAWNAAEVLFGEDVIAGLHMDTAFYRALVEHELRAKLLRLRQKAGGRAVRQRPAAPPDGRFGFDLLCALPPCHLARRRNPQVRKERSDRRRAVRVRHRPAAFPHPAGCPRGQAQARDLQPSPLFGEYLRQINVVIDAVDRMER